MKPEPNSAWARVRAASTPSGPAPVLCVAALAISFQILLLDRGLVLLDEGHLLAVVDALGRGQRLYRDVYTGITPGIYLLAHGLFTVFGSDLIVTRWAACAANGGIAALLFVLARRVAGPGFAFVAPVLHIGLLVLAFPVLSMLNYSLVALALFLFATERVCALLDAAEERPVATAVVARGVAIGLGIGATVWFKQNVGVFLVISVGCTLAFVAALRPRLRGAIGRAAAGIVVGGGAMATALLGYLLVQGVLDAFVVETMTTLVSTQLASFHHPFPSPLGAMPIDDPAFAFLYVPPFLMNARIWGNALSLPLHADIVSTLAIRASYAAAIGVALGACVALGRMTASRQRATPRGSSAAAAVAILPLGLFLALFPNAIWSHLAFVAPAGFPACAWLAASIDQRFGPAGRRAWRAVVGAMGLVVLVFALTGASQIAAWYPTPSGLTGTSVTTTEGRGMALRVATAFLQTCAREADEPVFVAPDLALLYHTADRPNPTPYYVTVPGNVDQERLVRALESSGTRCVVYNRAMYPEHPPMEELFPVVHDYLERRHPAIGRITRGGLDLELRVWSN